MNLMRRIAYRELIGELEVCNARINSEFPVSLKLCVEFLSYPITKLTYTRGSRCVLHMLGSNQVKRRIILWLHTSIYRLIQYKKAKKETKV